MSKKARFFVFLIIITLLMQSGCNSRHGTRTTIVDPDLKVSVGELRYNVVAGQYSDTAFRVRNDRGEDVSVVALSGMAVANDSQFLGQVTLFIHEVDDQGAVLYTPNSFDIVRINPGNFGDFRLNAQQFVLLAGKEYEVVVYGDALGGIGSFRYDLYTLDMTVGRLSINSQTPPNSR